MGARITTLQMPAKCQHHNHADRYYINVPSDAELATAHSILHLCLCNNANLASLVEGELVIGLYVCLPYRRKSEKPTIRSPLFYIF